MVTCSVQDWVTRVLVAAKATGSAVIRGFFNTVQCIESEGRMRLPNERLGGCEVEAFEAPAVTTPVGGSTDLLAMCP